MYENYTVMLGFDIDSSGEVSFASTYFCNKDYFLIRNVTLLMSAV